MTRLRVARIPRHIKTPGVAWRKQCDRQIFSGPLRGFCPYKPYKFRKPMAAGGFDLGSSYFAALGKLIALDQHGVTLNRSPQMLTVISKMGAVVLADGDDALGILHASLVLDGAEIPRATYTLGVNGGRSDQPDGRQTASRSRWRHGEPTTPPRTSASSSASLMLPSTSFGNAAAADTIIMPMVHQFSGLHHTSVNVGGCPGSQRKAGPRSQQLALAS